MQTEQELLVRAELRIARAERHLTEQARRIDQLRRDGHDMRQARALLKVMKASLLGMREQRAVILARIGGTAPRALRPANPRRP